MHTNPKTVQSPKANVSDVRVLYNTGAGGWALASLLWDGKPVYGARWNGDDKNPIGNPQSRGIPTWFVLPDEIGELVASQLHKPGSQSSFPPLHARVKLRPLPERIRQGQQQAPTDDTWVVMSVDQEKGQFLISNTSTDHFLPLWSAHVHSYIPEIAANGQAPQGILNLTVQVKVEDGEISLHFPNS